MAKKTVKKTSPKVPSLENRKGLSHAVRPTRRIAGLLGFLAKVEVDAIFDQLPFTPVDRSADPLKLWQQSVRGRAALPRLEDRSSQVETLPDELARDVDTIKKRRTFQRFYERVADYHFGMAPAEALLSPQWYADLDYVEELASRLEDRMDDASLLHFAMADGSITEPIIRNNQVVFSSRRLDLNANPIPDIRDVGDGEFEIVVRASSRPNYLQVAVLDDRLVLVNGVHKVLALFRHGYTKVPCVWRHVHNLAETGLNLQTTLFADQTFKTPRPALVLDLLNDKVAVPLLSRSMYQVMRLTISMDSFQVPVVEG